MVSLQEDVSKLFGVGQERAKALEKLGIKNVKDLIFYYPRAYRDFSKIIKITDAKINQKVAIKAKVLEIKNRPTRRRRFSITEVLVTDETGALKVLWFNQPFILKNIKPQDEVLLAGDLEFQKELVLKNPEYEVVKSGQELKHLGQIAPVYKENSKITSRWLRGIIKPLILNLEISDFLPKNIKKEKKFLDLKEALLEIHFPKDLKHQKKAKERLAFDEVFVPQLRSLFFKKEFQKEKSFPLKIDLSLIDKFKNSLPFSLTNSQRKAIWEILKDLKKENPMNRLLEGDVGSGKTIVATLVLFLVAKAGYQGIMMAPTEILAFEHFLKIKNFLKCFNLKINLLTSTTKAKEKRLLREDLEKGEIQILIGTHALLNKNLKFKNLALVVIDEQHRFGVKQRKTLREKNKDILPHFLSMTATPIPRTMALTAYGNLDISYLSEMPKGERKVKTFLVPQEKRFKAYNFIKKHLSKDTRALVICPSIAQGKLEIKAVQEEYKKLELFFRNQGIGLLHGKLKAEEKKETLKKFKEGVYKILISTSVIEVGIDIPEIKIMMIENADRFGLAQLHQLRGRIGRAGQKSYIFLFTDSKNPETTKRLHSFSKIKDGFRLAELDLEIRGPGEVFGTEQSGYFNFKLASFTDFELILEAKREAERVLEKGIEKFKLLYNMVKDQEKEIHLE